MAALPYMQFYVADYLADTAHLTTEEHGAYLLLIFNYWQRGKSLRVDRLATVARLSNERWASVKDSLEEFFYEENGEWKHKRIEADLQVVNDQIQQRVNAGKASARARALNKQRNDNNRSAPAVTEDEQPLNGKAANLDIDTKNENLESKTKKTLLDDFELLWNTFDKRFGEKGSRKKAETEYLKIKPDRDLADEMLFALSTQAQDKESKHAAGQFYSNFPHVERWLRDRRWTDEISQRLAPQGRTGRDRSSENDEAVRQFLAGEEAPHGRTLDGVIELETGDFQGGQH